MSPVERTTEPHRIAILPLKNISPDPRDEYFTDGMTEELISTVSKIADLRVIARTTAMRYRGANKTVAEIGAELRVRTVLEGSVRKAGDRLRIAVQLIDAPSDAQIWSADYDRDLSDVFAIQREIAERIAGALKVEIGRQTQLRLETGATTVVDAYTLYLEGRFHWNERTRDGLAQAFALFERALERDPKFARALSGLADAYTALAILEFAAPNQAFPKARQSAERALALDDNLAEAHASLGFVHSLYDRDWAAAERELRRAIELNPNYPAAHQFYADHLKAMGRLPEALEEMHHALDLDPLSLPILTGVGHVLYLSRDFDAAILQYRAALEVDPKFVLAHLWFGRPYLEKRMFPEAIAEIREAVELSHGSTISLAVLGHAYASAGNAPEAREILARLFERSKSEYMPSYWIALIYAGLGDPDEAFLWLDRAAEERSSWLTWIRVEPRFDGLRSDPRFPMLLRRLRLDDAGVTRASTTFADDAALRAFLSERSGLRLSDYRVLGDYVRYDESARNLLKDLRTQIVTGLREASARHDNFLLWAPPGTGKTFFVREA
ncbi:MAG TPA: tetratricopeptide repeat protein, partial [Thermoplasmata archaeon]